MPRRADRVQDTSPTTGTGSYTLSGSPVTGYRTFASAFAAGDLVEYAATDGTDWEVGIGVFNGTTGLTRATIRASSNSGNAVSWSAGTRNIWSDASAAGIASGSLGRRLAMQGRGLL